MIHEQLHLLATVLIAGFFMVSGARNALGWSALHAMLREMGVPLTTPALIIAIGIELFVPLGLFIPALAPWSVAILVAFTIVATLLFHSFWKYPAGHERFVHTNIFSTNIALCGGMLALI
jgi:putative oxidoreductase